MSILSIMHSSAREECQRMVTALLNVAHKSWAEPCSSVTRATHSCKHPDDTSENLHSIDTGCRESIAEVTLRPMMRLSPSTYEKDRFMFPTYLWSVLCGPFSTTPSHFSVMPFCRRSAKDLMCSVSASMSCWAISQALPSPTARLAGTVPLLIPRSYMAPNRDWAWLDV